MLQDLTLKTLAGSLIGFAKIDITTDPTNVGTKQVSVNDYQLIAPSEDDADLANVEAIQAKVEVCVHPRNYLMQDLVDLYHTIGVVTELNGEQVPFTTTTTTATPTTTTTTTV